MRQVRAARAPAPSKPLNITIRLPAASVTAARPIVTIQNADQIASSVTGPFQQATEVGDGYAIYNAFLDIGGDYDATGMVFEWGYEAFDPTSVVTIDPNGRLANITVDTSANATDGFYLIYWCSVDGVKFRSNIERIGSGDSRWTNECSGCP